MTEQYDLVLVDTPPVNLIADVQLLAASCDAVLLIARAFSTTTKMFEKAVQELAPFRVIGTVLNAGIESERHGTAGITTEAAVKSALSRSPKSRCARRRSKLANSTPANRTQWDRFVMASPVGNHLSTLTGWKTVVEKALGHRSYSPGRSRRAAAFAASFRSAGLRSTLFGDCLVSMPAGVYGGICADDRGCVFQPAESGQRFGRAPGCEVPGNAQPDGAVSDFPARTRSLRHLHAGSDAGPEKLLQGLPRDTRYAVRKSLKAGLDWTEDLSLDEFYEIYAQSVHRLGTPVFSKDMFTALQSRISRSSAGYLACAKGTTAIAGVLLFSISRPGDAVLWRGAAGILQRFSQQLHVLEPDRAELPRGIPGFSISGGASGERVRFSSSRSWSMQVTESLPYRYHLVRAKEVPQLSPVDQKFQLPISLWKKMPFAWTKIIGPQADPMDSVGLRSHEDIGV